MTGRIGAKPRRPLDDPLAKTIKGGGHGKPPRARQVQSAMNPSFVVIMCDMSPRIGWQCCHPWRDGCLPNPA